MRSRQPLPRGVVDFILERFDGFHDLLELKSPQDPIVEAPDAAEGPPPANRYSLSPTLAVALAQVHVYRDTLTAHEQVSDQLFGLPHTRDPRVIIVIGKAASLPDHRGRVSTRVEPVTPSRRDCALRHPANGRTKCSITSSATWWPPPRERETARAKAAAAKVSPSSAGRHATLCRWPGY